MSRNVFALKLRVSPRTLEKWEQGKTAPNDQAAAYFDGEKISRHLTKIRKNLKR
ncbi:MAG: hypothetical protein QM752_03240 [Gammaproteobacteria bacterium]